MRLVLRFVIFFATVGGFIALTHWFIYRRFIRGITSQVLRRLGTAVVIALALSVVPLRLVYRLRPVWGQPLATAWWFWIGFATYLALVAAALDSARWLVQTYLARRRRTKEHLGSSPPFDPERRRFLAAAAAGGAVAISGSASLLGAWEAYRPPEVTELPIRIPKLPKALDGFTILQLSDLHIGPAVTDSLMREVIARCRQLKPDLLAVTGDLVDAPVRRIGSVVRRLLDIGAPHGSFFVTGNHEYYAGDITWCDALTKMGFVVLRNHGRTIGDGSASFDLAGVDDWSARQSGYPNAYNLNDALARRVNDRACILLAHQPVDFDVAAERGVDLQLSGHTHGGQTFPLTALIGLRYPYSAGLYSHGPGKLYVSRGVGFVGPPMRLGAAPELVKIVLTS